MIAKHNGKGWEMLNACWGVDGCTWKIQKMDGWMDGRQ